MIKNTSERAFVSKVFVFRWLWLMIFSFYWDSQHSPVLIHILFLFNCSNCKWLQLEIVRNPTCDYLFCYNRCFPKGNWDIYTHWEMVTLLVYSCWGIVALYQHESHDVHCPQSVELCTTIKYHGNLLVAMKWGTWRFYTSWHWLVLTSHIAIIHLNSNQPMQCSAVVLANITL